MSKTLFNILIALDKIPPLPPKKFSTYSYLIFLLERLKDLDDARRDYFKDEAGRMTFDWVCQSRLLYDIFEDPMPEILDNIPYPKRRWNSLCRQAMKMAPLVKGDYILDRIDAWLLEAYTLHGLCEALPGDIVLDCGTFTGNTSLYFSQKTGETGRVYGFEPAPIVFRAYRENARPHTNIIPVNAALTSKNKAPGPDSVMNFTDGGPGASLRDSGTVSVPAIAIDTFRETKGLQRVDFIKMDIEGAEADALRGAAETIRAYRPKMALSAYHKAEDLFELPRTISEICPGYRFTLRHFSDGPCETVLFCRHSDDEYYFGAAPEEKEHAVPLSKLSARLVSMLKPRVEPGFLAEVSEYFNVPAGKTS